MKSQLRPYARLALAARQKYQQLLRNSLQRYPEFMRGITMPKTRLSTPLVTTLTTAAMGIINPAMAATDVNPFSVQVLESGYMVADNTNISPSTIKAPTTTHKHRHKTHHKHKPMGKIKEGTCSAEHRKTMEGKCGGAPAPTTEPGK